MGQERNTENNQGSSFSGAEVSRELERQAEIDKLSRDLLRDFYQTFRLSQKETAIQPPLFSLLADLHQQAGHNDIMAAALSATDTKVDELVPPRRHKDVDDEARNDPETGFRAMWTEYSNTLQDPNSGTRRTPELILEDMLVQDLYYQENERPNRTGQEDIHASFVREYILGNQLTGSAQLLTVRDRLRAILVAPAVDNDDTEWMFKRREELVKDWEANHPGQSFMPLD